MKLTEAHPNNPYFSFKGKVTSHPYAKLIKSAYDKSVNNQSKLPEKFIHLEGMSGKQYRHLINNLVQSIDDARYLEIGSWKGSTACAAIYGNKVKALCIDDWSGFGGPKQEFCNNIQECINDDIEVIHDENRYEDIDFTQVGKFNIYFYDGCHQEESQCNAIKVAQTALDDEYILIVDDWNNPDPRNGTSRAIKELELKVLYSIEVRTTGDDSYPAEPDQSHPSSPLHLQNSNWHNGYFIAVCKK